MVGIPVTSPLDLRGYELLNARLHILSGAPPTDFGRFFYDPVSKHLTYIGDAAAVIDPHDRSTHVGQQPVSSLSDFPASVRGVRLDEFAAPTSALTLNGQKITNLAAPTAAGDASSKQYTDTGDTAARAYADTLDTAARAYTDQRIDSVQTNTLDNFAAPTAPVSFGTQRITDLGAPTATADAATKGYVDTGDTAARAYADGLDQATRTTLTGQIAAVSNRTLNDFGAPTASLSIGGQKLIDVAAPTSPTDAATKGYVDTGDTAARAYADGLDAAVRTFVNQQVASVADNTLNDFAAPTGSLSMGSQRVTDVATPTSLTDAANKSYVDTGDQAARTHADDLDTATRALLSAGDTAARAYADSLDAATRAYVATQVADITDNTLSDFGAPTAALSIGGQRLVNVGAPTGSTDAATRGYVDTAIASVQGASLSSFGAPTSAVSMGGQRLTNLGAAVDANDAVTLGYMRSMVAGIDFKPNVRVATTAPIPQTGLPVIDGVQTIENDRILDWHNADATKRGIYNVHSAGAWTRAEDADVGTLTAGATVPVSEGTINAKKVFRLNTPDPIDVGTTALTWEALPLLTYSASAGVKMVGTDVQADYTVLVRKLEFLIGDGSSLTTTVTHNFGTRAVTCSVWEVATDQLVFADVKFNAASPTNAIDVATAEAYPNGGLRVVVQG